MTECMEYTCSKVLGYEKHTFDTQKLKFYDNFALILSKFRGRG